MKPFGKWICSPCETGAAAVEFRRTVCLAKKLKKATLRISAIGVYAAYCNRKRVGDFIMAPGWTSYRARVQYQTYDVTALLKKGENVLSVEVGQGWAVGYLGFEEQHHYYADHVSCIASLTLEYEDGTKETVKSDEKWDVYSSRTTFSELYHGETVDLCARIKKLGAAKTETVTAALVPQQGEIVREQERIAPARVIVTPKGERVIDFGQNLTGYAEVRVKAPRGARIVLHHAEVLDRDGNFYTGNLRSARNENTYISNGKEAVFKPRFCFQGFRYLHLVEYPFDTVDPDCFRAVAVHSDLERTGTFSCGNALLNQLYHNVVWGQKGNYLDVPTDCPQRDERLGWTGDAEVFCRIGAFNYNVKRFFDKWLSDMAIDQRPDGAVDGIIPECLSNGTNVSAGWADAAAIVPWEMYLAYGDRAMLRRYYPMMKKWVGYQHAAGPEEYLWLNGSHYGDWLAMDADPDDVEGATFPDLIASAYFAYSASLLVKAGMALGMDTAEDEKLAENVRAAFRAHFMENGLPKESFDSDRYTPSHRRGMTQTALILILHFGLCDAEERPVLAAKLASLIEQNNGLMNTGFIGSSYILHALSDNGYEDLAYRLLLEERTPSWLYSVKHGATTIWEHWNGIKEDGTFWREDMNSYNHYAYGTVFDWVIGYACGIRPREDGAGYKTVCLAPHPSQKLGYAQAEYQTNGGKIRTFWEYRDGGIRYEFEIPSGCTAYLSLPGGRRETLTAGTYHFWEDAGARA